MVQALSLLRNVGPFDNVAVGASLPLDRLTVVHAENGCGKTTLARILRSLQTGQSGLIAERRRLGAQSSPHVVIDLGRGSAAVFQNGAWARTAPEIAIFDDIFVARNVRSGIRRKARTARDVHRQTSFPVYEAAINDFLQRFNASFRVGPVDITNTRQGSSANCTLLIDGHPVQLVAPDGEQCVENTLSSSDRQTLALAFFFACLQSDPARADKIVVIDDPMTSLDKHRTRQTLREIDRLAHDVGRLIVLSHSKPFLRGVWDKCRQLPKAALEVRRIRHGSTLASWDVNDAEVKEHDPRDAVEKLRQLSAARSRAAEESALRRRPEQQRRIQAFVDAKREYPNGGPRLLSTVVSKLCFDGCEARHVASAERWYHRHRKEIDAALMADSSLDRPPESLEQ